MRRPITECSLPARATINLDSQPLAELDCDLSKTHSVADTVQQLCKVGIRHTKDNNLKQAYQEISSHSHLFASLLDIGLKNEIGGAENIFRPNANHELFVETLDARTMSVIKNKAIQGTLQDAIMIKRVFGASVLTLGITLAAAATVLTLMMTCVITFPAIVSTLAFFQLSTQIAAVLSAGTLSALSIWQGSSQLFKANQIAKGADAVSLDFELPGLGHF